MAAERLHGVFLSVKMDGCGPLWSYSPIGPDSSALDRRKRKHKTGRIMPNGGGQQRRREERKS